MKAFGITDHLQTSAVAGGLVLLLLGIAFPTNGQVPAIERQALIALFTATDGNSWTNNSNWMGQEGTECTWWGVTCSAGHVTVIDLTSNNLQGSLPSELGSLSHMERLYLRINQLSGSIPPELGGLLNLKDLMLGINNLTQGIPEELSNLQSLGYLELYSNQLNGTIPAELGNLSSLLALNLGHNRLSGTIPPELEHLSTLTMLDLSSNQLSGSIPVALSNLPDLQELTLYYNQLSGTIPSELGTLTNLESLNLHSNQLTGSIPTVLGNLSHLRFLDLGTNQLTGSIPSELGNLPLLSRLTLYSNQLTGSIPSELGNLPLLSRLALYSNRLSGSIPASLGSLSNLQHLDLWANQLSGTIPEEIGNLSSLRTLFLRNNLLTGSIPPVVGSISGLEQLSLCENQLLGEVPPTLTYLTSLTYLELEYNGLEASDPDVQELMMNLAEYDRFTATQTVAPDNVDISMLSPGSVMLTWDLIPFTGSDGGYRVFSATSAGGPFALAEETVDKTVSEMVVDGLSQGETYFFFVQTVTYPHISNQGTVTSEPSELVSTSMQSSEAGKIRFLNAACSAAEGESKHIEVLRIDGAVGAVSVDFVTSAGTATPGSDYESTAGTLAWADQEGGMQSIVIDVVDDALQEGQETVEITLHNVTGGATIEEPSMTVLTIEDNDLTRQQESTISSAGSKASIAVGPLGSRAVAWAERKRDGDGWGVFAQLYTPDGETTGKSFQVNTSTQGDQHSPVVGFDASERFLIAWIDESQAQPRLAGRWFGSDGQPETAEIVVHESSQQLANLDLALEQASGEFFLVWEEFTTLKAGVEEPKGRTGGVIGRRFHASGKPKREKVNIDTGAAGLPSAPQVSVNSSGTAVVAWERSDEIRGYDVYALLLDAVDNPLTDDILVNETTASDQRQPAVSLTDDGKVIVLWQDAYQVHPEYGYSTEINARVLMPSGVPAGAVFRVNQSEQNTQRYPSIAMNSYGDCWAMWEDASIGVISLAGRLLDGCSNLEEGSEFVLYPAGNVRSSGLAFDAFAGVTTVYVKDDLLEGDGSVNGVLITESWAVAVLQAGEHINGAVPGAAAEPAWSYYYLEVPNLTRYIAVTLSDLSADVDLYAQAVTPPTLESYACRSINRDTTDELCRIDLPPAERWWFGVCNSRSESVSFVVAADEEMISPRYPRARAH